MQVPMSQQQTSQKYVEGLSKMTMQPTFPVKKFFTIYKIYFYKEGEKDVLVSLFQTYYWVTQTPSAKSKK